MDKTFYGIEAENVDHAKLKALRMAGYHADPSSALRVDDTGQPVPLKSEDRKHYNRILRVRTGGKDASRVYRIKIQIHDRGGHTK